MEPPDCLRRAAHQHAAYGPEPSRLSHNFNAHELSGISGASRWLAVDNSQLLTAYPAVTYCGL